MFILSRKGAAAKTLLDLIELLGAQKGKHVKKIRSDGGTEFKPTWFLRSLRHRHIIHEETLPYTPQHNGVVERSNRTLMEMARSADSLEFTA